MCNQPADKTPAEATQQLEELVNSALSASGKPMAEPSSINWEIVILDAGDVGAAITAAASERQADLILMRSRRRPFAATLLGSTAEAVAHQSPCSVLVMHADEREWMHDSTGEIYLDRILVAHDFSSYSEAALQYGLSLAQEYQAEIHLLHVLPRPVSEPEIAWVGKEANAPYHRAARRLQESVPGEAHLWCTVKNIVQSGRPYAEILSYAGANEIDLICMGTHGSDFTLSSLLGSNVDRVLRQAVCPVLIAHPR
jgi:nucleotide-binding universal stress UspA family protein